MNDTEGKKDLKIHRQLTRSLLCKRLIDTTHWKLHQILGVFDLLLKNSCDLTRMNDEDKIGSNILWDRTDDCLEDQKWKNKQYFYAMTIHHR
ncbi:MAG TPA: hypothetical protein VFI73_01915 [Candidatus Nitrosopolaris sp.]|nr:hypothetical protein [Candidatus Nitrosopolaris sp.]